MEIKKINPKRMILEASTFCTLNCPTCPTASGDTIKTLGRGYLRFTDFKKIVDENPQVYNIELSNWGEVFLNKDLIKIMEYAYINNVALSVGDGSNMNSPSEEVMEALVKYKLRKITCAIDGTSQETYSKYRVNGDFKRVISNIEIINKYKRKYNSFFPILQWRFIIFGHNEHEILKARKWAEKLNMIFSTKLAWGSLYSGKAAFSPVKDLEAVRKNSGLGVASREEYKKRYGQEYINCCLPLWTGPSVNYDGRLYGCTVNYWKDYGNILNDNLIELINSSNVNYAREMLMGRKKEKANIPCSSCNIYKIRKMDSNWITNKDVKSVFRGNRNMIMLENKLFMFVLINKIAKVLYVLKTDFRKRLKNLKRGQV